MPQSTKENVEFNEFLIPLRFYVKSFWQALSLICSNFFHSNFSVTANQVPSPSVEDEDVGGMPDWAIAVVVIGLGSFAFVIVFGITVVRK